MLLVVDANILMAALIKDSDTRGLLMSDDLTLIAPEFLLEEAIKHLDYISRKTKLEKEIAHLENSVKSFWPFSVSGLAAMPSLRCT